MQQGAKVVAVDIRQEQLDKRVEELKTYGEDVIGIVGNVPDIASLEKRHYKIFCVNGNTGFRNESRIFYFIHLQNEEAYERKESSSA